jgi:hypothetical protein
MSATREPESSGGDDIDLVAKVALDSAEVANRSARAAAHTASKLAEVTAHFDSSLARQRRQMILIVSVSGLVALLAFAMFIASAIQLRGRVSQLNTVLAVVASRAIELKQGLEQIAPLSERVEGFATEVAAMSRLQRELQASVQRMDKTLAARPVLPPVANPEPSAPPPVVAASPASAQPRVPVAAAKPVTQAESPDRADAREKLVRQTLDAVQGVAAQSRALEGNLRAQSAALSGLSARVASIEKALEPLPAMQSDLKLLLRTDQDRAAALDRAVSERQREEALRRERERFVQFPRQPDSLPSSGAGSGAPGSEAGSIRR